MPLDQWDVPHEHQSTMSVDRRREGCSYSCVERDTIDLSVRGKGGEGGRAEGVLVRETGEREEGERASKSE